MCHKYVTTGDIDNFIRIRKEDIKVEYRHTCIMQSSRWKSECHGYVTLHPSKAGIYCKELKILFDASFNNAEQLKTIFEVSFGKDSHKINCLVLLYKYWNYGFLIPLNLLACLKNMMKFKKHSISLMFTSVIRSSYSYNLKSTIFNRLFPVVPLIEYFDYNAFGREVFNDQ
uniref:Uncharacterized protein n=1 Tax=Vespula pensylvanica TaxID=30213 RepID=A0A834KIQ6_VESPE|nr:hypothetical protein H0235_014303 [Vespula pensylvanica]